MYENEEGQPNLTWEQQQEKISALETEVARLARHAEIQESAADYRARRIAEVDFYLQEQSNWEEDTETVLTSIAKILDIDISTTKTYEVVVRYTVEVSADRGSDWSDIDSWAFGTPELEMTLGDFEIESCDSDIESVEEQ